MLRHGALAFECETILPCLYAFEALSTLIFGFRIECDVLEAGSALVAGKAVRVKALACRAEDASGDGQGALSAKSGGLLEGTGAVVWC